MKDYKDFAKEGLDVKLPEIDCFENQFPSYTITIIIPEYTSLCPKTGQPDFGTITIEYEPDKWVIELKSLKFYIQAYRNIGIFYENAVNRILKDIVNAAKPKWVKVKGEFNPRGGIKSIIEAKYP
ncbi:MAG: preQ(1) synthase [Candidatus Ratteibacteria bacterium]